MRILLHQLCVFFALDAQEPWALGRQLMHFADMLTHIQIVDYGMRFNQQIRDFPLQTHNNPSVPQVYGKDCHLHV